MIGWHREVELWKIAPPGRETFNPVPLAQTFFVPFAHTHQTGLLFCPTFSIGVALASFPIGSQRYESVHKPKRSTVTRDANHGMVVMLVERLCLGVIPGYQRKRENSQSE